MKKQFVPEHQVYSLLSEAGIKVPRHQLLSGAEAIAGLPFSAGEPVVLKGVGMDLWHKSDCGAVHFCEYDADRVVEIHRDMAERLADDYPWLGTLVTEKVEFKVAKGAPSEIFISLQRDKCCGAVVSFGFGGLLTEEWARELKAPLLIWPTSVYSPAEALAEVEQHWLGRLLLGQVRQQPPLLTRETLQAFIESLWRLDGLMAREGLTLLEVNPFVVDSLGQLVALDGVGLKGTAAAQEPHPVPVEDATFLNPQRIAIAGVSDKPGNVGALILENIRRSSLNDEQIRIIKPGVDDFAGIQCVPDVSTLKSDPVDILILSLPAAATVEVIEQLCLQNGGAQVVYIVAGGIGDGADERGLGERLECLIHQRRESGQWCPAVVGPNGLGMILSPLKLNSLFIPQDKLNIQFSDDSQVALISQSGAFLITRLSRHHSLRLKYGFSIGNQIDMKLSDFMALMLRDDSVRVLGLYIEGFAEGDACAIAKLVTQFRADNRHVVIYKGGRSELGKAAAEGHTGAMTGDYQLQKRLLQKAGAVVVETFNQFNAVFKWMTAYPQVKTLGQVSIITNAGYETVGSVDTLGDAEAKRLYDLTEDNKKILSNVFKEQGLEDLVSPANPLDLTPMADEEVYYRCIESMIAFGSGVVLVGLVPLSNQLDTQQLNRAAAFAEKLRLLVERSGAMIGVVVDAGLPFQEYRAVFENRGLPVFDAMDKAVLGINVLVKTS